MKKQTMDMCSGSLMPKIVTFLIPMIFTNLLQQLYHMADMMVAGKFSGSTALAAIGSTGYLTSFILNLFVGISVGASTVLSQSLGAKDYPGAHRVVHTSMAISVIGGLFFGLVGVIFCRPLLLMLHTPSEIINEAVLYMRIIFAGYPIVSVFNFGSALLRAKGDTKRPFVILTLSGIVNVILNCVFVIGFGMGVEGVAIPTVISQTLSTVMVLVCLLREDYPCALSVKQIRLHKEESLRILKIGIPIGIQTMMFSISNILIQSSINSFGKTAVAGASAAQNINSLLYTILTTCSHAATIFCGQNYGAKKPDRIAKTILYCCILCLAIGLVSGGIVIALGRQILALFTNEEAVVVYGLEIVVVIALPYFTCAMMEVFSGGLRALNHSTIAMITSIFGLCVTRIVWIYTYFQAHRSLRVLYYSYPLSWIITTIMNVVCFVPIFRRIKKELLRNSL